MPISKDDLRDGILLSRQVYNDDFPGDDGTTGVDLGDGWHLLSRQELGMGGLLDGRYFNGNYIFDNLNQQAFVATNGDTLAIAFRGTELFSAADWITDLYLPTWATVTYQLFNPLVHAVEQYLSVNSGIERVLATGHSLGGSMAQMFMHYHSGDKFEAVTFGSAGVDFLSSRGPADSRILNVEHTGDVVPDAPGLWQTGIPITIDRTDISFFVTEHSSERYQQSVDALTGSELFLKFSPSMTVEIGKLGGDSIAVGPDANGFMIIGRGGGDVLTGNGRRDLIDGSEGEDTLRGGGGSDYVWGGSDNDELYGESGNDFLKGGTGNDTIDGGSGEDTAHFTGQRSSYSISVSSGRLTVTDLRTGSPDGTDQLTAVEYLDFAGTLYPASDFLNPPSEPNPSTPTVNVADAQSSYEGASGTHKVKFAVSLSGNSSTPVVVTYSTGGTNDTATANVDYVSKSGSLVFAAGSTIPQYVDVTINGDTAPEGNETFSLRILSVTAGATIGDGTGQAVILNDDSAPVATTLPAISISDGRVVEGNSGITGLSFSVSLSAPPTGPVTVNWSTSNGTATIGDGDYNGGSGILTFQTGQTWPLVIVIPVNGDNNVEDNETFSVTLSNASGATIAVSVGVGTIQNDDVPAAAVPTVSIANASAVSEGNPGSVHSFLDFVVSLSTSAPGPVTVNWFTTNGSAVYAGLNGDYEAGSGLLQFAAGEQFKTVRIEVDTDKLVEGNETLGVSLWGANGARIGTATATGTIIDDDTAAISVTDATTLEGNDADGAATFWLSLSNPAQNAVTVAYTLVAGTASIDNDFTGASGTLTFNPGETLKALDVTLLGDTALEPNETFTLKLSNASGASIADDTGIGTIIADDTAAMWNLASTALATADPSGFNVNSPSTALSLDGRYVAYEHSAPSVNNGWINVYVHDRQTGTSSAVTSGLSGQTTAPSISADGRFVAYQSQDPTFVPGDTNGKVDVFVTDRLLGTTERLSVSGNGTQGNGDSTGPSISADGRYVSFVSAADNLVPGDTNGVADVFVYDRTNKTVQRVNLAEDGTQANAQSTAAVISADGSTVAFNTLASNLVARDHNVRWDTYVADRAEQTLEVVSVDANGNGGYDNPGLGFRPGLSADGRIVGFNTDWGLVASDSNGRWDTYTFDRGLDSFMRVSVGPDGQQGNQDTWGDVRVSPDGSQVTFYDFSSNLFPGHNPLQADIVVATRQAAPTLNIGEVSILEGQAGTKTVQFQVTLSGPTTQPVTVSYLTADGTALAGKDYVATNGSLTFAAGEVTKTVTVTVIGDTIFEVGETFSLQLNSATNALIGQAGAATILNDDAGPPVASIADVTVNEGSSGSTVMSFRVSLSAPWTSAVTVGYATADGSAVAGADYQGVAGSLTFQPGEVERTIDVAVTGDTASEGNETLLLHLSGPVNATIGQGTATGTVLNDDSASGLTFAGTFRVDVGSDGHQSTGAMPFHPSISADGRYVAFQQADAGLVAGDSNFVDDIFVHDRQTGGIERISLGMNGAQPTSSSVMPTISADGRYVAYATYAANIVAGDTNGDFDVFLYDRQTHTTELVSRTNGGGIANKSSVDTALSADARYVAFWSTASDLVSGDTNNLGDIFVRDRQTGTTELVSTNASGVSANAGCYWPSISGDGRYVSFTSQASNLVGGDTNGMNDVFVYDRLLDQVDRVNETAQFGQANDHSQNPTLSADGRFVAFASVASNLVAGDTNNARDVFVADLANNTIERVSVASDGSQGNAWAGALTGISADGRYVSFTSQASNLVAGDTNGAEDLFVHDRQTHTTSRVNLTSAGTQSVGGSFSTDAPPVMSADGAVVAYISGAADLVPGDTNNALDVFVAVREAGNTVSVAGTTTAEGNSGAHDAVFTVSLARAASSAVSIGWFTADGTAMAGSDYVAGSGVLTFSPGEISKTVRVSVLGDTAFEADESLSVVLRNPSGALIGNGTATGSITNDDAVTASSTVFSATGLVLDSLVADATLVGDDDTYVIGNDADNVITGNGGVNLLIGGAGRDILRGVGGDDEMFAGEGNDTVDGGTGTDTAIFNGERTSYQIGVVDDLVRVIGPDGSDTMIDVERLSFADGVMPVITPVESSGGIHLLEVINQFFMKDGNGVGPSLKDGGLAVTEGRYGEWNPLGAEQSGSGFQVAWKMGAADQYLVWTTDANGNRVDYGAAMSAKNYTLQSLETTFQQDLNGDGQTGLVTTSLESLGATRLAEVGNRFYLHDSGGAGPSLKDAGVEVVEGRYGAWNPIGAEQSGGGYRVAWKMAGADQFTVWTTDVNGNRVDYGTVVSGNNYALQSLETIFQQDLNGDGETGLVTTMVESFGSTRLTEVGNRFYLRDGGGAGPSLKDGGTEVTEGRYGDWQAIGAEQVGGNYRVAWKLAGADQYVVWTADADGNRIDYGPVMSGGHHTLQGLETVFQQDLNGDGQTGLFTAALETSGSTRLVQVGPQFHLRDSGGVGPSLKDGGSAVMDGQFGGWTPIGVEPTGGGYQVAWNLAGTDYYIVWTTDTNGNRIDYGTVMSGNTAALQSFETAFQQDLNGDGQTGLFTSTIELSGATRLVQVADNFYLRDGGGAGPALKDSGVAVTNGQFGGWKPIGVEPSGGGYQVAWKVAGADQYIVWTADASGNRIDYGTVVTGSDYSLQSLETAFQQDLNGDGETGLLTTAIEAQGMTSLAKVANQYFLRDAGGSGPSLKDGGTAVVAGQYGNWTPIGVEHSGAGYQVAWKMAGADQYIVWTVDAGGNRIDYGTVVSGSNFSLQTLETTFQQDLNGDGHVGPSGIMASSFDSFRFLTTGAQATDFEEGILNDADPPILVADGQSGGSGEGILNDADMPILVADGQSGGPEEGILNDAEMPILVADRLTDDGSAQHHWQWLI